jgi:choline dehydrogenase-like flavoprotein
MNKTELWFHEQMTGFFTWGADDPRTGEVNGRAKNEWFGFDLTIHVDDLDAFVANRDYPATVSGKYLGNLFGAQPVTLDAGTFKFMSRGAGDTRLMEHRHTFSVGDKKYTFVGTKFLDDDPTQIDAIHDLTTLYSTIHDERDVIVAAGVLHFPMKDFARLVASFDTKGPGAGWGAKMKFLRMFLRQELHVLLAGFREPPAPSIRRRSLVKPHDDVDTTTWDVVIIGSGYGGGAVAKELASWRDPATGVGKNIALFERGSEWRAGDFADEPWEMPSKLKSPINPTGLFDFNLAGDVDVLCGNGLGGTSLINANAMIEAPRAVFALPQWPKALPDLAPYYQRANAVLRPSLDPEPPLKSQVFLDAARVVKGCTSASLVPIAVAFERTDRSADTGNIQDACTRCGGCVSGCNFTAKGTVDMNYLSIAEKNGLSIYSELEVIRVETDADGVTIVAHDHQRGVERTIRAKQAVISAGTLGSFGILARSKQRALSVSDALGSRFSGNADVIGFGYNGEKQTAQSYGPTITSVAKFWDDPDVKKHFVIEEGGIPRVLTALVRGLLVAAAPFGRDSNTSISNELHEWLREKADLFGWQSRGALESSLTFLSVGMEDHFGALELDANDPKRVRVRWPGAKNQGFMQRIPAAMNAMTERIDGTFIQPTSVKPMELLTVHPLGGCVMGDDPATSVVDVRGAVHGQGDKLFVADGSIMATPLGVNPALTIAALGAYVADGIIARW